MTYRYSEPIVEAAHAGHVGYFKSILQPFMINCRDRETQMTALHVACLHGHVDIVHELVRVHANLEVLDAMNRTPLHVACVHGHAAIVSILLENGANVNAANISGQTPLHIVCRQGRSIIFKILLDHGADLSTATLCLEKPIDLAIEHAEFYEDRMHDATSRETTLIRQGYREIISALSVH